MGVADDLPNPTIRLGEANHGQRVVLVPFRNVQRHPFIKPIMTANQVRHPAESLDHYWLGLADKKFVELLRSVNGCSRDGLRGGGCRPKDRHR